MLEYSQLHCNWAEVKLNQVRIQSWLHSYNALKMVIDYPMIEIFLDIILRKRSKQIRLRLEC